MLQKLEVLRKMGKHTGITSECVVPMDSTNYMSFVKRPLVTAQIVIGTPGTIKKGISAKKLVVNYVKIIVFDEAYHMLAEDGFKDDSLRIMKDIQMISAHCQKEELSLESIKQFKVDCPYELSKVNLVINYDLPVKHENHSEPDFEVYLHKIGRAGRFGRKGKFLCKT
ncbi:hypothetical protein QYF36_026143 [Acer negundo]|nr:hypothetical protein QYF36_026143 [Acer negundo]